MTLQRACWLSRKSAREGTNHQITAAAGIQNNASRRRTQQQQMMVYVYIYNDSIQYYLYNSITILPMFHTPLSPKKNKTLRE